MSDPSTSRHPDTDRQMPSKASGVSPFDIAKKALTHVGRFQTPPTPSVYEVWYRYVEGVEDIMSGLTHAVEQVNSVSVEMLDQLHKQYCLPIEEDTREKAEELIGEMTSLQTVVDDQIQAGNVFGESINEAYGTLGQDDPSAELIAQCAKSMLMSNAAMQRQNEQLNAQLQASQAKVEALQNELIDSQRASMTDPLTGLGNRRHFEIGIRKSLADPDRADRNTYLFIIDIDKFKAVNDNFGHESGDKVIMYVAAQISRQCAAASISRIGGDEFAIITEVANYEQANDIATEIRKFFASTPLKLSGSGQDLGNIELSIGAACLRENDDQQSWFVRADKLLYQAKDGGRNKSVVEHSR